MNETLFIDEQALEAALARIDSAGRNIRGPESTGAPEMNAETKAGFCGNCGNPIHVGDAFCGVCGKKILDIINNE